jgi:transketolase
VQIDGTTSQVMEIEPLNLKWEAFGWHVISCNGNNIPELINSYEQAKKVKGKPTVIIANTRMGKGVLSIEGDYKWHGKAPSVEEAKQFITELNEHE